jgi:hypothetical protein
MIQGRCINLVHTTVYNLKQLVVALIGLRNARPATAAANPSTMSYRRVLELMVHGS